MTGVPLAEDFAFRGPVAKRSAAAFSLPDTLDQRFPFLPGPTPGITLANISLLESLVHGWDIATGAGLPYRPDGAVVAAVHAFASKAIGDRPLHGDASNHLLVEPGHCGHAEPRNHGPRARRRPDHPQRPLFAVRRAAHRSAEGRCSTHAGIRRRPTPRQLRVQTLNHRARVRVLWNQCTQHVTIRTLRFCLRVPS